MEHITQYWMWYMVGLYIAEKIVKFTPPTMKIPIPFTKKKIPIGKYDDLIVDGARSIISILTGKKAGK